MGKRWWQLGLLAIATGLILWQMRTPPYPRPLYPVRQPAPPADLGASYDPNRSGMVRGTVRWAGEVPTVPPVEFFKVSDPPGTATRAPNPNSPQVRGDRFGGVLVYLRGIDPARSRPWDLPSVSVRVGPSRITVTPGGLGDRIGITGPGRTVEFRIDEPLPPTAGLQALRSVRGRGAAFFTQMLSVPGRPVTRAMPAAGLVELSSAAAPCWLRAYLFVSEHPYAAVTQPDGTFEMADVPDGDYELVAWAPNWHIDHFENDPEMIAFDGPARLFFRPGVEKLQHMRVVAGQPAEVSVSYAASDFDR